MTLDTPVSDLGIDHLHGWFTGAALVFQAAKYFALVVIERSFP
jgi:hypothetical protein